MTMLKRKQLNQAFKKKYQHNIIHQTADRFGQIQVIDDGMIRSLHFDAVEKQSAMDLEHPEKLVLSYTQFMMAGFLIHPEISRILCIGLGGGSIPRFLDYHFKTCRVDIVEIREEVAKVAHDYFMLPTASRFHYILDDGAAFVRKKENGPYDLILVDAYDHQGVAEGVIENGFVESCATALSPKGIFCTNLWSSPRYVYRQAMKGVVAQFDKQVAEISIKDRTNRIVLGIKPGLSNPSLKHLKKRSRLLELALKLPFSTMLDSLVRSNPDLFK